MQSSKHGARSATQRVIATRPWSARLGRAGRRRRRIERICVYCRTLPYVPDRSKAALRRANQLISHRPARKATNRAALSMAAACATVMHRNHPPRRPPLLRLDHAIYSRGSGRRGLFDTSGSIGRAAWKRRRRASSLFAFIVAHAVRATRVEEARALIHEAHRSGWARAALVARRLGSRRHVRMLWRGAMTGADQTPCGASYFARLNRSLVLDAFITRRCSS